MINFSENILEVLGSADESGFDLWFKILSAVQSKVILTPYMQLYKQLQQRACNLLKNTILNFDFEASPSSQSVASPRVEKKA